MNVRFVFLLFGHSVHLSPSHAYLLYFMIDMLCFYFCAVRLGHYPLAGYKPRTSSLSHDFNTQTHTQPPLFLL